MKGRRGGPNLLIDGDAFKDEELGIARLQRPNLPGDVG